MGTRYRERTSTRSRAVILGPGVSCKKRRRGTRRRSGGFRTVSYPSRGAALATCFLSVWRTDRLGRARAYGRSEHATAREGRAATGFDVTLASSTREDT